jgi:hypothetical protein
MIHKKGANDLIRAKPNVTSVLAFIFWAKSYTNATSYSKTFMTMILIYYKIMWVKSQSKEPPK